MTIKHVFKQFTFLNSTNHWWLSFISLDALEEQEVMFTYKIDDKLMGFYARLNIITLKVHLEYLAHHAYDSKSLRHIVQEVMQGQITYLLFSKEGQQVTINKTHSNAKKKSSEIVQARLKMLRQKKKEDE